MQLHCRSAPAARHARQRPSARQVRFSRITTRYQTNDDIGTAPSKAEVSADDTYSAAVQNMPEGAWAGRWERWAPPVEGFKGGLFKTDDANSGWQLLTTGVPHKASCDSAHL